MQRKKTLANSRDVSLALFPSPSERVRERWFFSDNGFVSQYWYDASGERTVKASFDNEGVYINGALSGARTGTSKFTAYVSPYLVVSNGGNYTKHVYMGSQRITSKVSNSGIFKPENNPVKDTLQAKYAQQTTKIKERFDSLGVKYSGVEQTGGLVSSTPPSGGWGANPSGDLGGCYFYHPDHLGSSSLITDGNGHLVQHIQYVPFGEVFLEQRSSNSKWSTPYKFNGKELDDELRSNRRIQNKNKLDLRQTGLAYYHARYYDPRTSVWLSVDPLAEKYQNIGSYVYCANNPVKYVDPDGRVVIVADNNAKRNIYNTLSIEESEYVKFNENGILDITLLTQYSGTSENFTALLTLAKSETNYIFAVASKDINGSEFYDVGSNSKNPSNYSYGVTNMPGMENDPSPDNNVYIFTASFLDEKKQASNTAHEGYGHAYFFELFKTDTTINPNHTKGIVDTVMEYDKELKKSYPNFIFGNTNTRLEDRIKIVEQQAIKNYESKNP